MQVRPDSGKNTGKYSADMKTSMDPADFDWNELWKQAKEKKSWKSKKAKDWDRRASGFARRTAGSVYIDHFLRLLDPQPDWSVFDMGCGPGTLALPMAERVKKVSAVDFSQKMLEILKNRARLKGLTNIRTHHCSWQDDWLEHGIDRHDVAIASRSLAVPDLQEALGKLCRHARKLVAVTDRVGHGPFDAGAFAAIGRTIESGPDYMYTVNLLHQMGYLPRVDYIALERELSYADFDEALQSYLWMFRDITTGEKKRLQKYLQSITTTADNGRLVLRRPEPVIWAFISWRP